MFRTTALAAALTLALTNALAAPALQTRVLNADGASFNVIRPWSTARPKPW